MKIGQIIKLCLLSCALALGLAAPAVRAQVWQTNSLAVVSNQMLQMDFWGPGLTVGGIVSWNALTQVEEGNGDSFYGTGAVSYTNALQGLVTSGESDYVEVIWGMFIPPVTTNYVFYVCSDDYSQLYLSTDMTPGNLELIAEENQWSNENQWTASGGASSLALKRSDQFTLAGQTTPQYPNGVPPNSTTSTPKYPKGIPLVASNMYLIALYSEQGGGGDNAEATYKYEGQADPTGNTIITGSNIAWVVQPPSAITITITPSALTNYAGQEITFTSSIKSDEAPYLPNYQWQKNGVNITNADGTRATGSEYTTILATNDNNATFQLAVTYTNISTKSYVSSPVAVTVLTGPVVTGGLTRDYWAGQSGDLPSILSGDLPQPTYTFGLTNFESSINDNVDNYLERISGWFIPPTTGKYVFFIASDDDSDLFISTNSNPANKMLIAQETTWCTNFEWLSDNAGGLTNTWPTWNQASQKRSDEYSPDTGTTFPFSGGISLTAGQMYYIEADHYQGGGGDNCSATFKLTTQPDPTNGQPTIFAGANIATATSIATNLTIAKNLMNVLAFQGGNAYFPFSITTDSDHIPNYQWIINGTNFTTGTATNPAVYAFNNTTLAESGTTVQVIASLPFSTLSVTSALVTLTVEQAVLVTGEMEYQFFADQSSVAAAEAGTAGVPEYLSSIGFLQSPVNDGIDDYVDQISGFFIPPLTGTNMYVFNISSDDASDLWLSTDATAANARIIAQEANWSNEGEWVTDEGGASPAGLSQKESDQWIPTGGTTAPFASGIPLIGGQMYYMNVVHYQGGGGTQVGLYFWVEGATEGPYVGPPVNYAPANFAPTNIAMYAPPAHAWVSNSLPATASAMSSTTAKFSASGGSDSTYGVNALALTNVLYQWYFNGVAVAGATNGTFTTPLLTTNQNVGNSNATVTCSIGAIGAPWTNTTTYLTIVENTTPPSALNVAGFLDSGGGGVAGEFSGTNQYVDVVFNTAMTASTALNIANYTISGATITNVSFFTNNQGAADTTQVVLQLAAPLTNGFTLKISTNVTDLSNVGVAANTAVNAKLDPMTSMDMALTEVWTNGSTFYLGDGSYVINASGNDIWGTQDGFRYVYQPVTNNFDYICQLVSLQAADQWSKAGLMARETIDPGDGGSRNFYMVATPEAGETTLDASTPENGYSLQCRSTTDGSAIEPPGAISDGSISPTYPNAWVRITRVLTQTDTTTNDVFTGYYSTNGVDWTMAGALDFTTNGAMTAMPSNIYIGICDVAHEGNTAPDNTYLATSTIANYGPNVVAPKGPVITAAYVATTKSLTISWTPTGGTLMESPTLGASAVWTAVTPASNPVTVPISGTAMFFRVQ
ncbi:MAG: hypothetical protein ACLQVY_12225 [Limisphaerales bacterium]